MLVNRLRPVFFAAVLASGCFEVSIDAADFDRSCESFDDCAPVFSGDPCAPCACANAAINGAALESYRAESARLRTWCWVDPGIVCGACPEPEVGCGASRCELVASD